MTKVAVRGHHVTVGVSRHPISNPRAILVGRTNSSSAFRSSFFSIQFQSKTILQSVRKWSPKSAKLAAAKKSSEEFAVQPVVVRVRCTGHRASLSRRVYRQLRFPSIAC